MMEGYSMPWREWRKVFAIVLVSFAISHVRRKQARQRWLMWKNKKDKLGGQTDDDKTLRFGDHPFVPYLIENAYLLTAPLVLRQISVIDRKRPAVTWITFTIQQAITVNMGLLFQRTFAEWFYPHVPNFTTTKPSSKIGDIFRDYLRCNLVVDVLMGGVQVLIVKHLLTPAVLEERAKLKFRVFPFLGKFLLSRLFIDVAFYIVHRWLHSDFGYKMIHYRHHEHTGPRLQTNFHFLPLDLFLEAALPLILNIFFFAKLGIKMTGVEEDFIGHANFYFDAASHLGKEAPIATWFPPMSPLFDAVTGCDQRLIEYHTRHHQLFNCNYSISPWPDKLMGSYQMEYKVKDSDDKTEFTKDKN